MKVQRPGAYAVVVDGERVLLTELGRSGRWTLPGGLLDRGEDAGQTVRREVREETGLAIRPAEPLTYVAMSGLALAGVELPA